MCVSDMKWINHKNAFYIQLCNNYATVPCADFAENALFSSFCIICLQLLPSSIVFSDKFLMHRMNNGASDSDSFLSKRLDVGRSSDSSYNSTGSSLVCHARAADLDLDTQEESQEALLIVCYHHIYIITFETTQETLIHLTLKLINECSS